MDSALQDGISLMVFVYGIMGGYIFLAMAGGIGGWLTHPKGEFNFRQVLRSNLAVAVVVDLLYAIVVATLDPIGLFWRQ